MTVYPNCVHQRFMPLPLRHPVCQHWSAVLWRENPSVETVGDHSLNPLISSTLKYQILFYMQAAVEELLFGRGPGLKANIHALAAAKVIVEFLVINVPIIGVPSRHFDYVIYRPHRALYQPENFDNLANQTRCAAQLYGLAKATHRDLDTGVAEPLWRMVVCMTAVQSVRKVSYVKVLSHPLSGQHPMGAFVYEDRIVHNSGILDNYVITHADTGPSVKSYVGRMSNQLYRRDASVEFRDLSFYATLKGLERPMVMRGEGRHQPPKWQLPGQMGTVEILLVRPIRHDFSAGIAPDWLSRNFAHYFSSTTHTGSTRRLWHAVRDKINKAFMSLNALTPISVTVNRVALKGPHWLLKCSAEITRYHWVSARTFAGQLQRLNVMRRAASEWLYWGARVSAARIGITRLLGGWSALKFRQSNTADLIESYKRQRQKVLINLIGSLKKTIKNSEYCGPAYETPIVTPIHSKTFSTESMGLYLVACRMHPSRQQPYLSANMLSKFILTDDLIPEARQARMYLAKPICVEVDGGWSRREQKWRRHLKSHEMENGELTDYICDGPAICSPYERQTRPAPGLLGEVIGGLNLLIPLGQRSNSIVWQGPLVEEANYDYSKLAYLTGIMGQHMCVPAPTRNSPFKTFKKGFRFRILAHKSFPPTPPIFITLPNERWGVSGEEFYGPGLQSVKLKKFWKKNPETAALRKTEINKHAIFATLPMGKLFENRANNQPHIPPKQGLDWLLTQYFLDLTADVNLESI